MRLFQIPKVSRRWLPGCGLLAALLSISAPAWSQPEPLPPPPPIVGAGDPDRPDEVIIVGDNVKLLAPKVGDRLGNIHQIVTSRDGIVEVELLKDNEKIVPTAVSVKGVRPGLVKITLSAEIGDPKAEKKANAVITYKIQVNPRELPRIEDAIRAGIRKHFPRASVEVERAEGAMILSGYVDSTEDIDPIVRYVAAHAGNVNVINNLRVAGVMQVALEVCIAQVNRNKLRQLGFNFFKSGDRSLGATTIGRLVSIHPDVGRAVPNQFPPGGIMRGGQVGIASDAIGTNLVFGIFDDNTSFFGFIRALKEESVAKIIANPTLVTLNGRPANFLVGGEVPVPQATATGTPSIDYKEFGTKLNFVPTILGDGKVRLDVQSEISNAQAGPSVGGFPTFTFSTDRVQSMVEMESGQTLAIGGLLQNQVTGSVQKYPVLGELPFAGSLFRTIEYREEEIELLIMVTPKLVDALDCSQRPAKMPGQETRTPTDFELFLEGILEAPRGPRDLKPDGCYRPAHWNGYGADYPESLNGAGPGATNPATPAKGRVYFSPRPVVPETYTPMERPMTPVVVRPTPPSPLLPSTEPGREMPVETTPVTPMEMPVPEPQPPAVLPPVEPPSVEAPQGR